MLFLSKQVIHYQKYTTSLGFVLGGGLFFLKNILRVWDHRWKSGSWQVALIPAGDR